MSKTALLMTPGPTLVPEEVLNALARPVIHHRTKEFEAIMQACGEKLQKLYKTKNDVFILPASGTGAMEATVVNTISKGDNVLAPISGKFSERLADLCELYGATVDRVNFEWGAAYDIETLGEKLKQKEYSLVLAVHNETSTGVRNPIQELGALVKDTNALFLVDTISSLGGDEIQTDAWNIDLCISGSQKCLAMSAGLAFVSVSKDAWACIEGNENPRYYFDLLKYRKKFPQTPFSTPVSLVYGLEAALNLLEKEGLENRIKRHADNAAYCRKRVQEIGFELFPASEVICSNTLTAINSEKAAEIKKRLDEEFNIKVAGGQGDLKGKIFRIGHMGVVGQKEIDQTLEALQKVI